MSGHVYDCFYLTDESNESPVLRRLRKSWLLELHPESTVGIVGKNYDCVWHRSEGVIEEIQRWCEILCFSYR